MIITFIGHKYVSNYNDIYEKVYNIIQKQCIEKNDIAFYCGGYGEFDALCASACRKLKIKYPQIEIVFVTPYITEFQQKKIKDFTDMKIYDSSVYPPIEKIPPRLSIIKRNEWMISQSDLIISYIRRTYGGAYKTFLYAQKHKKNIIIV